MRKIKIDTITQITFLPKLFPVNCYLYEEKDSLTLIDAAQKGNSKALVSYLLKQEKPLERIILTHAHSDHIGDLAAVKKAFPQVKIYLSKIEDQLLNSPKKGNLTMPSAPIDHLLSDQQTIGSLIAIETPGHTLGSISLYAPETKAFIVGDLIQTKGRVAIAGDRVWSFPFPALATWDSQLAIKSVEKITSYPTNKIFCGHGEVIDSWAQVLRH